MSKVSQKSKDIAILGLFAAIIVVLQLLSYVVKIGTFNLSLVLIPIVLGAVLYGPSKGAILGGVFGAVVVVSCFTGLDAGGYILVNSSPIITTLICLIKGILAGLAAGFAARLLKHKNLYLSVFFAALVAPVVNTGIFIAAMLLFFKDTLTAWAGGAEIVYYVIFSLVGVNFLIELAVNMIFSPAVLRVVNAVKRI